jgi:hypothetical protein
MSLDVDDVTLGDRFAGHFLKLLALFFGDGVREV